MSGKNVEILPQNRKREVNCYGKVLEVKQKKGSHAKEGTRLAVYLNPLC